MDAAELHAHEIVGGIDAEGRQAQGFGQAGGIVERVFPFGKDRVMAVLFGQFQPALLRCVAFGAGLLDRLGQSFEGRRVARVEIGV